MHQQTPTPINPSLKGSVAETPDISHCGSHTLQTLAETRWKQWTQGALLTSVSTSYIAFASTHNSSTDLSID